MCSADIRDNLAVYDRLLNSDRLEEIVDKIVGLADGQDRLIDRFNSNFLLDYFDRSKVQRLEKVFSESSKKMDMVQFVRYFLSVIEHRDQETIYLTIALIDIFKELSQGKRNENEIAFLDLTNYFCEVGIVSLSISSTRIVVSACP